MTGLSASSTYPSKVSSKLSGYGREDGYRVSDVP